ncbi:hypothetical protein O3G_MSEX000595 [Manduca sexta]|nr:hypothetical protein O3G_MSEX000595 [Manduca sexta]
MESSNSKECSMSCDPTDARRLPVPGPASVKLVTEDNMTDQMTNSKKISRSGDVSQPSEKISIRLQHRIGTWNVRGLLGPGKLQIVEKEMKHHHLSILGLCETHMRGQGHFKTASGNTMYFCGPENESRSGVAFVLPPHVDKHVLGYNAVSDRIITLKLNTKPCILNLIQVYAPTEESKEEVSDSFYGFLLDALKAIPNREVTMILGDWNAKIGNTSSDEHLRSVVGKFGLGMRSTRGEKLLDMCIDKKLSIMNTYFQHHPRRTYTWKSPGDRYRNQIDYIIIDARWRSSVSNVKTFPGADFHSDHNLLVAWFGLRFKNIRKVSQPKPRQIDPIKHSIFREMVEAKLLEKSQSCTEPNAQWEEFKSTVLDSLEKCQPSRKEPKTNIWLSTNTWELVQERKDLKCRGFMNDETIARYTELCKFIKKSSRQDKNNFILNLCRDVELHANKMQTADLFKKVRLLSKQFKPKS